MPFDASKPYSDAPTGGFNPSKPYTDSPPPPQEKTAFSGSFGDVTMNAPYRNPVKDIGAGLYGLATSTLGGAGDLGLKIPSFVTQSLTGVPATIPLPSTNDVRKALPESVTPGPGEEAYVTAGEYAPLVTGLGGLARGVAGTGLIKGADLIGRGVEKLASPIAKGVEGIGSKVGSLVGDLKGTESAARTAKLSESLGTGQLGKNILSRATKAGARRKNVADNLYKIADERMQARFDRGEPWQTSPAGKAFFSDIMQRLRTDEATHVTSDTRKALSDLMSELVGTQKTGGGFAYSTPEVLTRTLRELREAAAGEPKEGFKAIGQQEAGDLAKKLSNSLGEWEPMRQSADVQYAAHSKDLYPEGVTPGKFGKEKRQAEKTINLLETRMKQGTIQPEAITKAMRQTLKSPAVARLVSGEDARQINAELDAIDAIRDREAKVKAAAKMAAKYLGAGALLGSGAELAREIL